MIELSHFDSPVAGLGLATSFQRLDARIIREKKLDFILYKEGGSSIEECPIDMS